MRSGDVLFLTGGSNQALRLHTSAGFGDLVSVDAWRRLLDARRDFLDGIGVPWRMMLVPEKLGVLGDALLDRAAPGWQSPGLRLAAAIPMPAIVCPHAYLRQQHARGYSMYPRTDSHWTSLGAFSAFQWLLAQTDMTVDFAPYFATAAEPLHYRGDLWDDAHSDLPAEPFDRRRPPALLARVVANPIVRLKERTGRENETGLHVGSHVVYRNEEAERPQRLLLFGSSFSDYRLSCSLLTFVAALFFREVHFVWSASLDPRLVERVAPDFLLIEMPERFLATCPDDRFDLPMHEAATLAAWDEAVSV